MKMKINLLLFVIGLFGLCKYSEGFNIDMKSISGFNNNNNSNLIFKSIEKEYYYEKLIIEGYIPTKINGTLFRNGFGKFEGHEFKFNHLFDSLALILKFDIDDGNVYFQSRLMNSKYYNQSKYEMPLYRTLGGLSPNMTHKQEIESKLHFMHDNLNANIVLIGDNLVAVSDLAGDIMINMDTLEVMGNYNFINQEKLNIITSAHPQEWSVNKNLIFNYESDIMEMKYKFYFINTSEPLKNGQTYTKKYFYELKTDHFSYVHSFSLTRKYLIFIEYPVYWNIDEIINSVVILPSIKWMDNISTKIHIIDLSDTESEIITLETKPFFSFHHINAFDFLDSDSDMDNIFLELITYENASILDYFYMDNLLNLNSNKIPGGNYSKLIINLNKDKQSQKEQHKNNKQKEKENIELITEVFIKELIEMPSVNPIFKGLPYKYFYSITDTGKIIKVNIITGEILYWSNNYDIPTEPIFIPYNKSYKNINMFDFDFKINFDNISKSKGDLTFCKDRICNNNDYNCIPDYIWDMNELDLDFEEDNGIIVSVVLDVNKEKSYLVFLDAKTMKELAKAYISTHIPFTCHGFFK